MFSSAVEREGHCKRISLACVGSAFSRWDALGLPQPKAMCTSQVHTAQAPGCSERALSHMDPAFHALPGLCHSGSRALRKGPGPDGLCVLCPSSVRAAQVTKRLVRSALVPGQPCLMHLPGPDHSGSRVHHEGMVTVSRVPFVSSGKLISGCDTPGRC